MATYVIGDVQGCFGPLEALLGKVSYKRKRDVLWFAGDLINRGPASLATLRFVRGLGDGAVTVLGNHDLHFLAIALGGHSTRPADTLDELLGAKDSGQLAHWLRRQPLLHRGKGAVMTHAGIPHIWRLKQATKRAGEVEAVLRGKDHQKVLRGIYGNRPDVWHKSLRGIDRLRTVVNYLTRMRFVSASGKLEFTRKGGIADAPAGFKPWFHFPTRVKRPILFGHWASLNGVCEPHAIGLDTGCVWRRRLTAYRLEDGKFIRVAGEGWR